ncbi:hypothetical protein Bbelb_099930 [Branchiostoma belcheri]|nr:hypothetical protein Bbelb_099930 [Branchiostoma belcheri]
MEKADQTYRGGLHTAPAVFEAWLAAPNALGAEGIALSSRQSGYQAGSGESLAWSGTPTVASSTCRGHFLQWLSAQIQILQAAETSDCRTCHPPHFAGEGFSMGLGTSRGCSGARTRTTRIQSTTVTQVMWSNALPGIALARGLPRSPTLRPLPEHQPSLPGAAPATSISPATPRKSVSHPPGRRTSTTCSISLSQQNSMERPVPTPQNSMESDKSSERQPSTEADPRVLEAALVCGDIRLPNLPTGEAVTNPAAKSAAGVPKINLLAGEPTFNNLKTFTKKLMNNTKKNVTEKDNRKDSVFGDEDSSGPSEPKNVATKTRRGTLTRQASVTSQTSNISVEVETAVRRMGRRRSSDSKLQRKISVTMQGDGTGGFSQLREVTVDGDVIPLGFPPGALKYGGAPSVPCSRSSSISLTVDADFNPEELGKGGAVGGKSKPPLTRRHSCLVLLKQGEMKNGKGGRKKPLVRRHSELAVMMEADGHDIEIEARGPVFD